MVVHARVHTQRSVLMSRVSSVETKTRCIGGFFEMCPTPSAALDADPSDVHQVLAPLGLFENRMRAVVAITERFLQMPEFEVGLDKEVKVRACVRTHFCYALLFCLCCAFIFVQRVHVS